jgi:hypothetical protein
MYKPTSTFFDPLSVACALLILVAATLAFGAFSSADVVVGELSASHAPLR